jgi:hypothetical protein
MFDFFYPKFDPHLIKKDCTNIVKFKLFLKKIINKPSYDKRNDILHKFFNKRNAYVISGRNKQHLMISGPSMLGEIMVVFVI